MGKYVISTRSNGDFQFMLKGSNGQPILTSQGYTSKSACLKGLSSVKSSAKDESKFDRRFSANGIFYFNLSASNGQVIATSEMYESAEGRENGIKAVKANAPESEIADITVAQ